MKQSKTYNPIEIESKWRRRWEESRIYQPDLDRASKPFYNLMMFPYPSAEGLHVGSVFTFTGVDTYGRFKRMQGYDVFEPIGLDGFGIHSENYALKVGRHPKEQAKISEANFYRQLASIGNGFDWSRKLETYDPLYYKWTQWIFIEFFKRGLAYRKKSPVNFCPSCKTVLADEQVITRSITSIKSTTSTTGRDQKARDTHDTRGTRGTSSEEVGEVALKVCERCGTEVEIRNLEQWFFRITEYAERLLGNIDKLNWTEKVKIAQRNWIGKSQGVNLRFKVKDMDIYFEMFDSVPQTFMAQTFTVIAPEHPKVYELVKGTEYEKPVMEFVERIKKKKAAKKFDINKETEGIFTGRYIDYTPAKRDLPIWVAPFVIAEYGTGVVNASAHDERDFAFAKKYNLPLHPVMFPEDSKEAEKVRNLEYCYHHAPEGILTEPVEFKGRKWGEVRNDVITYIEKSAFGKRASQYHLRDWLISRQRYWGPPIPMIFCEKCDWQPVPEKDLPVLLPDVKDWKPKGTGKSPLASVESFVNTTCPNCKGAARRETDVSDTFLDSSWYFFRYISTEFADKPFDKLRARKWLPVTMYIGGAEHSVLHLLYSRFITMVFKDMGLIGGEEPYARFYAHGLIIKEGAKMSKSRGNIINPDQYLEKYGADVLRAYLRFVGPFDMGGDFRDSGIEGMERFLKRVWKFVTGKKFIEGEPVDLYLMKLTKEITEELENLRFNTAVARLMMYLNFLIKKDEEGGVYKDEVLTFIKLLAPFVPFLAEELWEFMGQKYSVHSQPWPTYDEERLKSDYGVTIAVQVNGKTRATFETDARITQKEAEEQAGKIPNIQKHLEGKKMAKVIYVEGKILNFVTK